MAQPQSLNGLDAVVLAGGLGTRLRPAIGAHPKALAPVAGRPFLSHLFSWLRASGLQRVVLCVGFGADEVESTFGDGAELGLQLVYSRESELLGTGGALRLARPLLGGGPMLVLNGDSLLRANLSTLVEGHLRSAAAATLLLARVPDRAPFGAIEIDRRGRILAFEEKGRAGPGPVNAGVYVINRDVLEQIPEGRPVSLEKEIFPRLVGSLRGVTVDGPLVDIGTPQSLVAAQAFLAGSP
jgi:NDP-sugar pyrophosphorylase family protein